MRHTAGRGKTRVQTRVLASSALGIALVGVGLAITVGGAFAHLTGASPLPASLCSPIQNPDGNLLVASDLPLRGSGRSQAIEMTKAIAFVFEQNNWKAGKYTLAYQSCDDATGQAGRWDPDKCARNAAAQAANTSVVGVIGTSNSGCSEIEIPIDNRAKNGPLVLVSPANTYVGLTHTGPGTAAGEPGKYYPTGKRNFARVIAANDFQGAANAILAQRLGVRKLFILNDSGAYGQGVAMSTANAAKKLGITIAGYAAWDTKETSYSALAHEIGRSGAQAVFLGGLIEANGGRLIQDIRAAAPNVKILAPDGFTPVSAVVQQSSGKADGMTISVAGLPNEKLPAAGKAFVESFSATIGGVAPNPYSVYAAQAAQVLMHAIAKSDGTRAGVAARLFKINLTNGILGHVSFDANGDLTVDPVTIYLVKGGKATTYQVIVPASKLVAAA